ncbi:hypothetical protein ACFQX4_27160 [Roseomonas sp. GCM10028921]
MALSSSNATSFPRELRSVLATVQCLSEYAGEQGDTRSAAVLRHAALLIEASLMPVRAPASVPARRPAALGEARA